jgi:RimJ/RimL family protein N-acetyltransferase
MLMMPAGSTDIDRLVLVDADQEVMRFINGGLPSSRLDVARRVTAAQGWLYVAFEQSTDEFVGWFSTRPSADGDRELGYRLRRDHWGRGLATEGARALIQATFDDVRVQRVWAQTMTVNAASRRVLERCGLTYVRTFWDQWPGGPIEGSEHGDVEYELHRSALAPATAATAPATATKGSGDLTPRPRAAPSHGDARASTPDCPAPTTDTPPR